MAKESTRSLLSGRCCHKLPICVLAYLVALVLLANCPAFTSSEFTPQFVWSAVNKSLEEDRLPVVDKNNEKVRVRGCFRVVLYNNGSERYAKSNHSGGGDLLLVDATYSNFSSDEVVDQVKTGINRTNPGICVPCIVLISLVNVSANPKEQWYKDKGNLTKPEDITSYEEDVQKYKLELSQQLTLLLQYKTPIPARHLILVRLVKEKKELTQCHGKKYTRYPSRLVSIWEQALFDHFREARVIQGALEGEAQNKVLVSGKETGVWVWMCEEIIARLELQEKCDKQEDPVDKEQCHKWMANVNVTTATVEMDNRSQCRMYRART